MSSSSKPVTGDSSREMKASKDHKTNKVGRSVPIDLDTS